MLNFKHSKHECLSSAITNLRLKTNLRMQVSISVFLPTVEFYYLHMQHCILLYFTGAAGDTCDRFQICRCFTYPDMMVTSSYTEAGERVSKRKSTFLLCVLCWDVGGFMKYGELMGRI